MALERQVRAKLAGKRNPEQEKEAQEWIESILGKKFPPGESFEDVLKDGQVLCHLMNKLSPGSVPKINTTGGQFKMMENINLFQKALKDYGVDDVDVFQTVDLWEKKDIAQVVTTLFALGRTTYKHPEWKGPYLGPKPSDECKRDFSEEQLRAGQTVIGLQAGSNKGATQAGQNMGAGRKILLGKNQMFVKSQFQLTIPSATFSPLFQRSPFKDAKATSRFALETSKIKHDARCKLRAIVLKRCQVEAGALTGRVGSVLLISERCVIPRCCSSKTFKKTRFTYTQHASIDTYMYIFGSKTAIICYLRRLIYQSCC